MKNTFPVCLLFVLCGLSVSAQQYSWQKPHAQVLSTGDLKWQPQPFVFKQGASLRYVDFAGGNDDNPGTSKNTPWKHHSWDPMATGKAAACKGVHTYVFKRGVTYRGSLVAKESGQPGNPIRLTSDPSWGTGEAVLSGSEAVRGWKKGAAHKNIPDAGKVWWVDLNYSPRYVWAVDSQGKVANVPIARTPNWKVSDPEDVMSEWWKLEQPQWWQQPKHQVKVGNRLMHRGTDAKHLTKSADYYVGAKIWSEWGIVMGTPFPSLVETYDGRRKAVAYQGIWFGASGRSITNNRYFLEDKPHYLDSAGEHWFEKKGEGGRLFIRLPGDADPNRARVEVAKRYSIIEDVCSAKAPNRLDVLGVRANDPKTVPTQGVEHLEVTGLSFRFNNTWWNTEYAVWMHKEVDPAAIRLRGSCDNVSIANCRFEHVVEAIQVLPINKHAHSGSFAITDNYIAYTGDDAINVARGGGSIRNVDFLRNKLFMIGMRPNRQSSAHAVTIGYPLTMEVAGNILNRTYGAGLFLFGGKPPNAGGDVPFGRYLVHHNRVEQTLLAANDWGGIETWQGGPFYVYNNISANPGGLWWPGDRLGFAFYLDGGFKNYLFNNIAWGANNKDKKLANAFAFYEAVGTIHNSFMNNTIYRFKSGSSWSPRGGHHHYAGNLWSDISEGVYNHGKLKEDAKPSTVIYPYGTMAYGPDVFHQIEKFGNFENHLPKKEAVHQDFASMEAAVKRNNTLNGTLGVSTNTNPLRDPANRDMRLVSGSAAIDRGVIHFVPWGLYGMVGEWNFYHNGNDVGKIPDEHWYMADYLNNRGTYHETPQFPLRAVNVTKDNYVWGPLENWIKGALQLNGKNQYAVLTDADMNKPYVYEVDKQRKTVSGDQLRNPQIHTSNFLIEICFKTAEGQGRSILVEKMGGSGYSLVLNAKGGVTLAAKSKSGGASVDSVAKVNDGKWHHLIAEADRQAKTLTIYLAGRKNASGRGLGPESLANSADLLVGGSPKGNCLKGTIEFARICQGTLQDAKTTIAELFHWQFHGPQTLDFTGRKPTGKRRDAGALEFVR